MPAIRPILPAASAVAASLLPCLALARSLAGSVPDDPPAAVVAWTAAHAVPLSAVEASHGFSDLEPLRRMIGEARIVALGETTHGSREVFQMKHRLLEYLATELGFTLFAIEANLPEAQRLDDYVRGGPGDPVALVRGMGFWTWSTAEVRDMVEWMRRFNADPANRALGRQVGFTGFDMQSPDQPAANARRFVADRLPADLARVDEAVAAVRTPTPGRDVGHALGELPPKLVAGKRVILSAWIRTERIDDGWAGLCWGASTADRRRVVFENMQANGPRGSTPWRRYEITATFPPDVAHISLGAILSGRGQAWFDDLQLSIDGRPYDPAGRFDFGFEGDQIAGFDNINRDGYAVDLATPAHRGKQSLHIASLDRAAVAIPPARALDWWRDIEGRIRAAPVAAGDPAGSGERDWAAQNAHLVVQCLQARLGQVSRDAAMAENVAWLSARHPGAKIVLWAHNGHVARRADTMGGHLAQQFGEALCVVGFATGRGTYRAFARNGGGLGTFPLTEPVVGSVEAACDRSGLPRMVLDLRPSRTTAAGAAAWFAGEHFHRLIGSGEMVDQFSRRRVGRDYDLLVWIAASQASELLPGLQ